MEVVIKIEVKDNNIEQALRILKRKLQRDSFFKNIRLKNIIEWNYFLLTIIFYIPLFLLFWQYKEKVNELWSNSSSNLLDRGVDISIA